MKLYELTEQFLALQELAYDPEVDEQTFQDTMEGLWGEIEDKADGYAKIIMGMKADIEALRAEEGRLAARRKALENRQQALKNNLEPNMRVMGKTKFKTALFSFNIQKNAPSVRIDDEARLMEALKMEAPELLKTKIEIDKKALLSALKAGAAFKGAEIQQSESLRIR